MEDRFFAEIELGEADAWAAVYPEQIQLWWYAIGQVTLAAVWEHPEEDLYTLEDGIPI